MIMAAAALLHLCGYLPKGTGKKSTLHCFIIFLSIVYLKETV